MALALFDMLSFHAKNGMSGGIWKDRKPHTTAREQKQKTQIPLSYVVTMYIRSWFW